MASPPMTPGVYITEPGSFPPSIVPVDTAIPAFIGYTERATLEGKQIPMTPVRIGSMAEYRQIFGGRFQRIYYLSEEAVADGSADRQIVAILIGDTNFRLVEVGKKEFNLYDSLVLFFANGGGDCFIVSCGTYDSTSGIVRKDLNDGLDSVANVVGPTILLIPDASLLPVGDAGAIAVAMLLQCEDKRDRVAILDVTGGGQQKWETDSAMQAAIDDYRTSLAAAPPTALSYGMAYFPFVMTSVVQPSDVSIANFDSDEDRARTLRDAFTALIDKTYPATAENMANANDIKSRFVDKIGKSVPDDTIVAATDTDTITHTQLTQGLSANIPAFGDLLKQVAASQNILPTSGAIAGIFTANDANLGVWFAPANVGIALVDRPASKISDRQQQDLNVPAEGMSINVIRSFPNRGTLVWGARTLDGNSNDWRYIQVRRTMNYIEQSVKDALNRFATAPNSAQTWVTIVSMIDSFLHGVWAGGGLMGSSPAEAYQVQCGLGSTMTGDDILNGNMNVQIVLQMVHPAEFIELTFRQQMLGGS